MSNQAQNQSSTICFLVEQACEDNESYNDYSQQIVIFVKQNQSKEVRPIIDTIKKVLKNKKKGSPTKVLALQLLNECLTQAHNDEFLLYIDSKIVRRLGQFARFKKESTDLDRGSNIFGTGYDPKASANFLNLLLFYIQSWSQNVHSLSGKQTEISKTYQALIKERVTFPPEETIYRILNQNKNVDQNSRNTQLNDQRGSQYSRQSEQGQKNSQALPSVRAQMARQQQDQIQAYQQEMQASMSRQSNQSIPSSQRSQVSASQSSHQDPQSFAKEIKEGYKKLAEHHNASKLVEEVMQMGGDGGDQLDDQLLTEFRSQLYEGKEFSEEFLKKLMESAVQIKDKEQKIDKILSIIGEISTNLEKILIIKPFTSQELRDLQNKKRKEQTTLRKEILKQDIPSISQQKEIQQDRVRPNKKSDNISHPPNPQEIRSNQVNKSQNSVARDSQVNQNVFKTNFAMSQSEFSMPDQHFDKDVWGTGAAHFANQNQNNFGFQFQEYDNNFGSFEPIKSTFDSFNPSSQSSFRQSPDKKQSNSSVNQLKQDQQQMSARKIQHIQQPIKNKQDNQFMNEAPISKVIQPQKQNSGFDFDFPIPDNKIQQKDKQEEVKVAQPVKQPASIVKEVMQKSVPVQKIEKKDVPKQIISNKLQPKPNDLGMSMKEDPLAFSMTFTSGNQNLISSKMINKQPEAPLSNGIEMIQQSKLAQIQESPDADLSDEDEFSQVRNSMIESDQFKFPSPSKNNSQLKISQNREVDPFSFEFNLAQKVQPIVNAESNIQKIQSIEDPFRFEEHKQQEVVIQKKNGKGLKVMSGFEPQKKDFQKSVSQIKREPEPKLVQENIMKQIEEDQFPFHEQQEKPQFDFNFGESFQDTDPSFQTQQIIMHSAPNDKIISKLNDEITTLSFEKDFLKHEFEGEKRKVQSLQEKLKSSQDQNHDLQSQVSVLNDKIRAQEREKQDLQKRYEDLERQIKQYKKFEFLHEEVLSQKLDLEKQLSEAQISISNLKHSIQGQEASISTKDKEIASIKLDNQALEEKIIQTQQRAEQDLEDLKQSEAQTKMQLQRELFESKKREDQIRVQLQSEVSEIKRREEAQIRKLISEVEEIKFREEELQQKYLIEEEKAIKRENLLKDQIQQLLSQNEELKSKQKQTPQQKLVLRASAIKFQNVESSRNEQIQSVSSFQSQNLSHRTIDNKSQREQKQQEELKSSDDNKNRSSSKSLNFNISPQINNSNLDIQNSQKVITPLNSNPLTDFQLFDELIKTQNAPQLIQDTLDFGKNAQKEQEGEENFIESQSPESQVRQSELKVFNKEEDNLSRQAAQVNQQVESNDEFYDALNELDIRDDLSSPSQSSPIKDTAHQSDKEIKNLLSPVQCIQDSVIIQEDDDQIELRMNQNAKTIEDDEEQLPPVPSSDSDREDAQNDLVNLTHREEHQYKPTTPVVKQNPHFSDMNSSNAQNQVNDTQNKIIDFDFNFGSQRAAETLEEQQNKNNDLEPNNQNQYEVSFSFAFPAHSEQREERKNSVVLDQEIKEQSLYQGQSQNLQIQNTLQQPQRPPSPIKPIEEISSLKKQDSFMEMFGDILSGSTNTVTNQQQQKQEISSSENKVLDLDDLLNFTLDSPQKNNGQFKEANKIPIQQNHLANDANQNSQMNPQKQDHKNFIQKTNDHVIGQLEKQISPPRNEMSQNSSSTPSYKNIEKQGSPSPLIEQNSQVNPLKSYSPGFVPQSQVQNIPEQLFQSQQNFQSHQNQGPQLQIQSNNQQVPHQDIAIDKSQFTTVNTEQIAQQQQLQQKQSQMNLNPQAFMRQLLQNFFRKSLGLNKSVLFEDQNLKIGMLSDFKPTGLVNVKLFFASKNMSQNIQDLKLSQGPLMGLMMNLSRDHIPQVQVGEQYPVDLSFKIATFQLSIPIFQLTYVINNQLQPSIPLRIPVIVLRFCTALPALDAQTFLYKWNFDCNQAHQFKLSFSVDFTQCRSLTQLKELLQLGKNTFNFVEGVEPAKNILCGATTFTNIAGFTTSTTLVALIKITITANGQNCEIVGRSNDNEVQMAVDPQRGKFVQHVMNNILEMIALQVNPQ